MIIFDGSGSMWGRLDGDKKQSKLELGREALRASLAKLPGSARYGLISFGHRRSGDCGDVEVVAAVAAGDPARVLAPLEKLNPRGRGPVVAALREAVKALGSGQGPQQGSQSNIILIHDNADNCRQDACEAATEIAAANPKLKIHVVSLALEKDELDRVACVAKSTGGRLFDVRDAAGVPAAIDDAVKAAFGGAAEPARPEATAAAVVAPVTPSVPSGPPGLRLAARLVQASQPLTIPVRWRVLKPDGETVVHETVAPQVLVPVEAGTYIVEARAGLASARREITAAGTGPTAADVTLEAAALRIKVSDLRDGPVSSTALATLKKTSDPSQRPVWAGRAEDLSFVLPAGAYTLHISDSLVERDESVTVAAGETVTREINLASGRLELTAVARPDGPLVDGVTFLIAKDDPDAPDGRREIARSAAVRPSFALPAGTYYVTVRTGSTEVRQRVGIGAGDSIKRAVSLGLAKVTIAADGPSGRAAAANARLPMTVRVLSLEGDPREIASATGVAPEFTLTGGRYRIEAIVGTLNVKAVQDVDVEPGSERRVSLKLDAGAVTLKLNGPATEVMWELRDAKGMILTRSSQASPRLILAPGRYTARCTVQGKGIDKPVEVTADGQARVVEFAVP